MVKFKGGVSGILRDSLHDLVDYIQYELRLDVEYALLYVVVPGIVMLLVLQGSAGLLQYVYRKIFPPGAPALHR